MSQPIRGQGGHLVFPIGPKNDLAPCQVLLNSVQRRSRKCEKLTTTDGRRTTYDHNRAFGSGALKHSYKVCFAY